jgi:hypothetical protein
VVKYQLLLLFSGTHGTQKALIACNCHSKHPGRLLAVETGTEADRTVFPGVGAEKNGPRRQDDSVLREVMHTSGYL